MHRRLWPSGLLPKSFMQTIVIAASPVSTVPAPGSLLSAGTPARDLVEAKQSMPAPPGGKQPGLGRDDRRRHRPRLDLPWRVELDRRRPPIEPDRTRHRIDPVGR